MRTVLIWDDVCSAPPTQKHNRRGIAGLVPIVKLAGAASQKVSTLAELEAVAKKAVLQTRSVGVSMAPVPFPRRANPPSTSPKTRSASAWASTANPEWARSPWPPPTTSP